MKDNIILRIIAKLLIPLIILFALYVQFHGDFGAGGGFQAGVIFATAFVLYDLVFGEGDARAEGADRDTAAGAARKFGIRDNNQVIDQERQSLRLCFSQEFF